MSARTVSARLLPAMSMALVLVGGTAGAQTGGVSQEMEDFARTYFENGSHEFSAGHFAEAARAFREAHAITHRPELQFNIARALEGAGDLEGALEAYGLFAAAGSPGFDPMVIQRDMAALRQRIADRPLPPPPTPVPSPVTAPAPAPVAVVQPTPRVEYHRPALQAVGPWVLVGTGGALGVVAAVAAAGANSHVGLVNQANAGTVPWSASVASAYASAPGEITASWVLGGGAVALVAGGVTWLFLRPPPERRAVPVTATVVPTHGGLVMAVGGSL